MKRTMSCLLLLALSFPSSGVTQPPEPQRGMAKKTSAARVPVEYIARSILVLRGHKVLLDSELAANKDLAQKLSRLERSLVALDLKTQHQFKEVYEAIRALMAAPAPKRGITCGLLQSWRSAGAIRLDDLHQPRTCCLILCGTQLVTEQRVTKPAQRVVQPQRFGYLQIEGTVELRVRPVEIFQKPHNLLLAFVALLLGKISGLAQQPQDYINLLDRFPGQLVQLPEDGALMSADELDSSHHDPCDD
jgi:hypothetical protein